MCTRARACKYGFSLARSIDPRIDRSNGMRVHEPRCACRPRSLLSPGSCLVIRPATERERDGEKSHLYYQRYVIIPTSPQIARIDISRFLFSLLRVGARARARSEARKGIVGRKRAGASCARAFARMYIRLRLMRKSS